MQSDSMVIKNQATRRWIVASTNAHGKGRIRDSHRRPGCEFWRKLSERSSVEFGDIWMRSGSSISHPKTVPPARSTDFHRVSGACDSIRAAMQRFGRNKNFQERCSTRATERVQNSDVGKLSKDRDSSPRSRAEWRGVRSFRIVSRTKV